jgi:hypothetical protein
MACSSVDLERSIRSRHSTLVSGQTIPVPSIHSELALPPIFISTCGREVYVSKTGILTQYVSMFLAGRVVKTDLLRNGNTVQRKLSRAMQVQMTCVMQICIAQDMSNGWISMSTRTRVNECQVGIFLSRIRLSSGQKWVVSAPWRTSGPRV